MDQIIREDLYENIKNSETKFTILVIIFQNIKELVA